jgi:hypothetical protein
MAARRRISFSCSRRRTRFLYSRSSFGVGLGQTGTDTIFDVCLLEPGMQSGFGDPEVLGHLADRCFPFTGHGDDVSVELCGERLWHGAHPSCELVLVRLGDNQTLGSPHGQSRGLFRGHGHRTVVYIAVVNASQNVLANIYEKHQITYDEVKEAVVLQSNLDARWVSDTRRGLRLYVKARTFSGRSLNVVLYPIDQVEGMWGLATAMPGRR